MKKNKQFYFEIKMAITFFLFFFFFKLQLQYITRKTSMKTIFKLVLKVFTTTGLHVHVSNLSAIA